MTSDNDVLSQLKPVLEAALVALCRTRPSDPITWLAGRLQETKPPAKARSLAETTGLQAVVLEQVLDPATADAIFDALDIDGNGKVSAGEMCAYIQSRDVWCSAEQAADLTATLDKDKDGIITREELRAGLLEHSRGPPPISRLMALRPPPAGVPIFEELMRPSGPLEIPRAEERAITLAQLKLAFAHASRRSVPEGWLGKRLVGRTWQYTALTPTLLNLYDFASHVILPATRAVCLAGTQTCPSFVELFAEAAQPPEYFVSHFWGEPLCDSLACLAQHTRDREHGGGKKSVYARGPSGDGVDGNAARFWVCAFANRQWSLGGDVTEDPAQTSFHRAISLSKGTVAIVDAGGAYFGRIWCCYEIYQSLHGEAAKVAHARQAAAAAAAAAAATQSNGGRRGGRGAYGAQSRVAPDVVPSRFTYDVYTACRHESQVAQLPPSNRSVWLDAVGITDGTAAADNGLSSLKAAREASFPPAMLMLGLQARIEDGEASVESDKIHILNAIAAVADLNASPPLQHGRYDFTNATLRGRLAASSLRQAIIAGGSLLDACLLALTASPDLTDLEVDLTGVAQATTEVMARVGAALPDSLVNLEIVGAREMNELPSASRLYRLKKLALQKCYGLKQLPSLEGLSELQYLFLGECAALTALPAGLERLGGLKQLLLSGCRSLTAMPDLSMLEFLERVTVPSGKFRAWESGGRKAFDI